MEENRKLQHGRNERSRKTIWISLRQHFQWPLSLDRRPSVLSCLQDLLSSDASLSQYLFQHNNVVRKKRKSHKFSSSSFIRRRRKRSRSVRYGSDFCILCLFTTFSRNHANLRWNLDFERTNIFSTDFLVSAKRLTSKTHVWVFYKRESLLARTDSERKRK